MTRYEVLSNIQGNYIDTSVRWTDKVTLCANGDIVEDFTGKVVGYIDKGRKYFEETDNE